MILGTTFSPRQAKWLDLNSDSLFDSLIDMSFDMIRLGCYWDEIENEKGIYDFSSTEKLLKKCEEKHQKVVLVIGMKSPRWPEFYFPEWVIKKDPDHVETEILTFIQRGVEQLSHFSCITHWQVENEPLDPSGPHKLRISEKLLEKEISVVRSMDARPIVVNVWGNALTKRMSFQSAEKRADIVGIDMYYKTPFWKSFYTGPLDSDRTIANAIHACSKPVWISELQAEPWERHGKDFKHPNPESINLSQLKKNINHGQCLHPQALFFWGYEYWMYRKACGDASFLTIIEDIIQKNRVADQLLLDQMS